ncbi:Uncharacterised protein [Enterobacter hormaechei]|nr:Uncharacterised protein [Enterobacter hormaechei]
MGYGQPLAQRRRAKRFPMENVCQKRIGVGYFAQRHQPRRKLTDCLITAGELRLHADSTGVGQSRQVHKDPHLSKVIVWGGLWQTG